MQLRMRLNVTTDTFSEVDTETVPKVNPKARPIVRPPLSHGHDDVALADMTDLEALTRMQRSWLHAAVRDGRFPAPVIREPRCTRWRLADVRRWLIERAEKAAADTQVAEQMTARAKKASAAAKAKRVAAALDPQ